MTSATPERRRALAPLDANKQSPTPARLKLDSNAPLLKKPVSPVSVRGLALARSPVKSAGTEARKRPREVFAGDENMIVKKTCVEMEVDKTERTVTDDVVSIVLYLLLASSDLTPSPFLPASPFVLEWYTLLTRLFHGLADDDNGEREICFPRRVLYF